MQLDEIRKGYVKYRLEMSKEDLEAALLLYNDGKLKAAANRSYYCIFHAMRAVLAMDNVDYKHHSGVISYFRREYIKTGRLDKELSKIIQTASMVRNSSDYDDFYLISQSDTKQQIDDAEQFYAAIKKFIEEVLAN